MAHGYGGIVNYSDRSYYTSQRGTRGGGNFNGDSNYNSLFLGSSREHITWSRDLPSSSHYNNGMNSEYYFSAQGNSNNDESRYRYSGHDNRYSVGRHGDNRSYYVGGRSHIDSDMTRYLSSSEDFSRSRGDTSYSYIGNHSNISPDGPNNWGSNNYRHYESLMMYNSDVIRMQSRVVHYSQFQSSYSNQSYTDMNARGSRVAVRPGMRGRSSTSDYNRNSYRDRPGLIKPTSSGRTNGNKRGFNKNKRRKHTIRSRTSVMRDGDHNYTKKNDNVKNENSVCIFAKNYENTQDIGDEKLEIKPESEKKISLGADDIEEADVFVAALAVATKTAEELAAAAEAAAVAELIHSTKTSPAKPPTPEI